MDEPSILSNPLVLLVLLAIAAGAIYWYLRQYGGHTRPRTTLPPPEDDLRTLGLSEVRPRTTASEAQEQARPAPPPPEPEESVQSVATTPARDSGRRRQRGGAAKSRGERKQPAAEVPAEAPERAQDVDEIESVRARPASAPRSPIAGVAPLLDSLRSSLGARGVVLLRFDEINDGYEVVGRAGEGFGGNFNFPAPGNALIRKANPQMEEELLAYGLRKMQEFGLVTGGDAQTQGILVMNDARWKQTFDFMVAAGLVKPEVDYRKAYTLQALKGIRVLP